MLIDLARNWWALGIRGIAAVVFGLLALFWPPTAFVALVLVFGAYAVVLGAVMIGLSLRLRSWASHHSELPGGDFARQPA